MFNDWIEDVASVVNGKAESEEGGALAWAWIIVEPKVYPGIPMPQRCRRVYERTVVAADGILSSLSTFHCKYLLGFLSQKKVQNTLP